jgi:hypothetical protein
VFTMQRMMRPLAVLLLGVACGSETLDFQTVEEESSVEGFGGQDTAVGGASAGDVSGTGLGQAGAGGVSGFRRGGYAGSSDIIQADGSRGSGDAAYRACTEGNPDWVSPFYYDAASCVAGSLCTPPCVARSDCPSLSSGPAAECRDVLLGNAGRNCALPCEGDEDCPEDMRCLSEPRFGQSCMFWDVPWSADCSIPED